MGKTTTAPAGRRATANADRPRRSDKTAGRRKWVAADTEPTATAEALDRSPATPESADWSAAVQAALGEMEVVRQVPLEVRGRLDEAILVRQGGTAELEALHQRLELSAWGVTLPALQRYADRLEAVVRPAAASALMGAVLGCLPEDYRRRLVAGGEVLLVSRVLHRLAHAEAEGLSIAELAKLATVLRSVGAGRLSSQPHRGSTAKSSSPSAEPPQDAAPAHSDRESLAEAVRTLYGLPWPPRENE